MRNTGQRLYKPPLWTSGRGGYAYTAARIQAGRAAAGIRAPTRAVEGVRLILYGSPRVTASRKLTLPASTSENGEHFLAYYAPPSSMTVGRANETPCCGDDADAAPGLPSSHRGALRFRIPVAPTRAATHT